MLFRSQQRVLKSVDLSSASPPPIPSTKPVLVNKPPPPVPKKKKPTTKQAAPADEAVDSAPSAGPAIPVVSTIAATTPASSAPSPVVTTEAASVNPSISTEKAKSVMTLVVRYEKGGDDDTGACFFRMKGTTKMVCTAGHVLDHDKLTADSVIKITSHAQSPAISVTFGQTDISNFHATSNNDTAEFCVRPDLIKRFQNKCFPLAKAFHQDDPVYVLEPDFNGHHVSAGRVTQLSRGVAKATYSTVGLLSNGQGSSGSPVLNASGLVGVHTGSADGLNLFGTLMSLSVN